MKFKLQAGAELDLLTRDEIKDVMRSGMRDWVLEAMRGPMPKRFAAQGTITANAVTVDGSNGSGVLGPEAGFAWLITRVAVSGVTLATDATALYVNAVSPWNLVLPNVTGVTGSTGYHEFPSGQITLRGNDRLILASTGSIAATGQVTLTGSAWEVPETMLWKLLT